MLHSFLQCQDLDNISVYTGTHRETETQIKGWMLNEMHKNNLVSDGKLNSMLQNFQAKVALLQWIIINIYSIEFPSHTEINRWCKHISPI